MCVIRVPPLHQGGHFWKRPLHTEFLPESMFNYTHNFAQDSFWQEKAREPLAHDCLKRRLTPEQPAY